MTDRPIIFSAPMIVALLAGQKSQTRRLLKPQPPDGHRLVGIYAPDLTAVFNPAGRDHRGDPDQDFAVRLPYHLGGRLWVREAWADQYGFAAYRAGHEESRSSGPRVDVSWRSPIHMPRWASRLTLTVTDVRVQRAQEISEEDAIAEGACVPAVCEALDLCGGHEAGMCAVQCIGPLDLFEALWASIYGAGAWAANPWVCAISFETKLGNIAEVPA